jgi:hypothetical protein
MKRIVFKFAGGPLDGKTVAGERGEQTEARRYYVLTNHGKVGQRFRIASDYAIDVLTRGQLKEEQPLHFQPNIYEVVDRVANRKVLLVFVQHVGSRGQE